MALPILLFLSAPLFAAPQLAWEARHDFGVPTRAHQVVAMTLDSAGDIIIAGNKATAIGDLDYAVLKYSQTGTQLWAKTYNSAPLVNDQLLSMAVDSNGNVYITGTSRTIKYNKDGVLQWVLPYAGRAVTADSNEFAYVVGFQTNDFVTVKLAPEGTNVWLRTHDRPFGPDQALAVALGPAGEVYVAGTVTWRYDERFYYLKFALVKYDAEGNPLWVSPDFAPPDALHGAGEVTRIIVLDSDRVYLAGNFVAGSNGSYVTGLFDGEAGTNIGYFNFGGAGDGMTSMVVPPSGDLYLTGRVRSGSPDTLHCWTLALRTNVTQRWLADSSTPNGYNRGNGIALDALGNIYVTGHASTNYTEAHFIGHTLNFLTIKYDNDGRELWQKRYNGPANGRDIATGIVVTPDGGIFVAGTSHNTNSGSDITLIKYVDIANIQWLSKGAVLLQFPATPGQSVRFQASTNLTTWQDIATVSASPAGIARYTDTTVSNYPHRFYRTATP